MLNIELDQTEAGYTICRPVGELDAFTVSQFRQALAELASTPRLLIDMSGVPFVDSAALAALEAVTEAAMASRDPMSGPLRMGVIPTIGPFLLPRLLPPRPGTARDQDIRQS